MKKFFLLLFTTALALSASAQVNFVKTTDLNALLRQAKQENKLVFIDAYTDWCGWCKELDKRVFATPEVGDTMRKYFIATKFEMEKDSIGILLMRKYGVFSYPTALILNGDGYPVYWIEGYSEKSRYLGYLRDATDLSKQIKERGYSNRFDLKYPEFYLEATRKDKRKMADSATLNSYMAQQQDLSQEVNWAVLKRFYWLLNDAQYERVLASTAQLKAAYGQQAFASFARGMVGVRISKCTQQKDFACMETHLATLERVADISPNERTQYVENFYTRNKLWSELSAHLKVQLNDTAYTSQLFHLNDLAWNIYEKCDDAELLQQATSWMLPVVTREPVYMYLDTYAALLYKTHRMPEAAEYARKAIAVGRENGEDVSATEKLLVKIEQKK